MHWIALCGAFGFQTIHECCRRALYGNFSFSESYCTRRQKLRDASECGTKWTLVQPSTQSLLGTMQLAADSNGLQQLAQWSADSGIFLHPDIEFVRGATEYRDYRCRVKSSALVPDLTPLIIVPVSCVLGFMDPMDEAEKKDMMKGTATAAGVAIENKNLASQQSGAAGAACSSSSSASPMDDDATTQHEDACKYFFDSLSLIVNDCIVAAGNSTAADRRHVFASQLLYGTRTLKNAPYLSDRDFAVVGQSCPLAEALRHMVHNFVDNGPLSGKVERVQLQSAVSLALSHSTVLADVTVKREVDHMGGLLRGAGTEIVVDPSASAVAALLSADTSGKSPRPPSARSGVGIIPWLHLLPHGGGQLNAVTLSFSSKQAAAASDWIAEQLPAMASPFARRHLKNGFFMLVACEDIGPGEEVCAQTMAPLNPVRVSVPKASERDENDEAQKKKRAKMTDAEREEERSRQLELQYEIDKEYDSTLAMWMVTTASAPAAVTDNENENDDEHGNGPVSSAHARFVQSCVSDAVRNEIKQLSELRKRSERELN